MAPLLTRREVVAFVKERTGAPLTYSRLMKDAALGRGPKPAAKYGNRFLYGPDESESYGHSLITSLEQSAA
jgi:hypothetical protein